MPRFAAALVCAVFWGCAHADTYAIRETAAGPLPSAAVPLRLTWNPEGDWSPAWSSDGSLGYSMRQLEREDRDRCLAYLPPDGGRARVACRPGPADRDSTNAIWTHATSPGGRLAFVYQTGHPGLIAPAWRDLYVGPADDPGAARVALRLPYRSETGVNHDLPAQITWADESTLVYLAKHVQYHPGAIGIPPDTNTFGLEIVELRLAPAPSRRTVPGSVGATSITRDPVGGQWYATFALDPVVYALDLGTGQRTPAVSFAGLGAARDVQVRGGRVYAVVGGFVVPAPAALVGVPSMDDQGGQIAVADIGGAGPQLLTADTTRVYLGLALHPSGDRLAAEGFSVTAGGVARASDLFLLRLAP